MNPFHVDLVFQGRNAIEKWRIENNEVILDLSDVDFSSRAFPIDLRIRNANLRNTDLSGAALVGALFQSVDFTDAKMNGTHFAENSFINTQMKGVELAGASLENARFDATNLENCNCDNAVLTRALFVRSRIVNSSFVDSELMQARFDQTTLLGVDFCGARFRDTTFLQSHIVDPANLGEILFMSPSRIDSQTVANLKGTIGSQMIDFLRHCGLEKWEIEMAKMHDPNLTPSEISDHLTTKVFPMRTPGSICLGGVFISYSHSNSDFVDKLYSRLKEKEIPVYLDKHDFTAGSLEKNISRAIRVNDQIVVVLSRESLASEWVWDEIATALEKEKELNMDVLFPVAVDSAWSKNPRNKRRLMRQLKERLILDFSVETEFDENLRKLITGMKVNR